MRAGRLSDLLKFYSREVADDGAGNQRGALAYRFSLWAELMARPGSEAFAAARFEGRVPYSVRVRRGPEALQIQTDWVAEDERGTRYNIQAPHPDPRDRGAVLFTMVAGGRIE